MLLGYDISYFTGGGTEIHKYIWKVRVFKYYISCKLLDKFHNVKVKTIKPLFIFKYRNDVIMARIPNGPPFLAAVKFWPEGANGHQIHVEIY